MCARHRRHCRFVAGERRKVNPPGFVPTRAPEAAEAAKGQGRDCVGVVGKDRNRILKLPWRAWNREKPNTAAFDPLGTSFSSIEVHWLMGTVQREGGDLDVEAFAVPGFHLIAARHHA